MNELITWTLLNLVGIGGGVTLLLAGVLFLARRKWPVRYASVHRRYVPLVVVVCLFSVAIVWLYVNHLLHQSHLRETGQAYVSGLKLGLGFLFGIPVVVSWTGGISLGMALAGLIVRPINKNPRHTGLLLAAVVTSIVFPIYLGFWHSRHHHGPFMPTSIPRSEQAPN